MSIPLGVERRMADGDCQGKVWLHIVGRSMSLVALGLFVANAPQVDRQQTGISAASWALLGFATSRFAATDRILFRGTWKEQ
jgi:hypothetical protein